MYGYLTPQWSCVINYNQMPEEIVITCTLGRVLSRMWIHYTMSSEKKCLRGYCRDPFILGICGPWLHGNFFGSGRYSMASIKSYKHWQVPWSLISSTPVHLSSSCSYTLKNLVCQMINKAGLSIAFQSLELSTRSDSSGKTSVKSYTDSPSKKSRNVPLIVTSHRFKRSVIEVK